MPTFKEVAADWMEQMKKKTVISIDCNLIFSILGDIDVVNLTSTEIQNCLSDLYDNSKLRGMVYASYEKFITDICQFAVDCGYIAEIPPIEHRREPNANLYYPPDEKAMELLLSHEDYTPAGTILRLAWYCGLGRHEITFLQWNQVDLKIMQIVLPDRKVPLIYEMVLYLRRLNELNSAYSEYVLISQRKTAPMAEQSVSALVRRVLDNYGQNNVRLSDLRSDFIVRALKKSSLEHVSYISGLDLPAIQEHYFPYIGRDTKIREDKITQIAQTVRDKLFVFMQNEEASVVGMSMRFVWQLGVPVTVLPLLTWDLIDFNSSIATFIDRTIIIPEDFLNVLRIAKNSNEGNYNNIILNETKKKPTDSFFIQKSVQQSLISSEIHGITLPALQYDYWKHHNTELKELVDTWLLESPEVKSSEVYSVPKSFPLEFFRHSQEDLISYLSNNSSADYRTIKEALNLTEKELSLLLKECQEDGKIVKVGIRYFLPGQVVQRDKQNEVILSYVEKHQPVTSAQ